MKTFPMIAFLLIVLSVPAFAQEPPQVPPTENAIRKTFDDILEKWKQQDKERDLGWLADYRNDVEIELVKYNDLLTKRTELTEKLKRALDDGDQTLIEVALDDIRANKNDLQFSAKWLVQEWGKRHMDMARSAYRNGYISEEDYTEQHLNFSRENETLTKKTVPEELAKLIEEAKQKIPEYFARLERIGRPYPF